MWNRLVCCLVVGTSCEPDNGYVRLQVESVLRRWDSDKTKKERETIREFVLSGARLLRLLVVTCVSRVLPL